MKGLDHIRKAMLTILAAICTAIAMPAQNPVYLSSAYTPVESHAYKTARDIMGKTIEVAGIEYKNGFVLTTTHGPTHMGYAEFSLGGKYKTLNFILGTNYGTGKSAGRDKGIFVITADGRKVLDKKVSNYDVPEYISLDISGVDRLRFEIIVDATNVAVIEPTLWTAGQTPRETGKITLATGKATMLVRDLPPFLKDNYHTCVPDDRSYKDAKTLSINGQKYTSGIKMSAQMALIGNNSAWSYFNLGGKYRTLKFIAGATDTDDGTLSTGWLSVFADGKVIKDIEIKEGELAKEYTIDITGCKCLSFNSAQASGDLDIGVADIMVYPEQQLSGKKVQVALVDNSDKLNKLPDVCKLISNIPPYAVGGGIDRENMVYSGKSDYITFSMGGIKYSEGLVLRSSTSFFSDNTRSHALFNVGGQFDYVSFTVGWIGKSNYLKNDTLRVYADNNIVFEQPIIATGMPQHYIVPIRKCKRLGFETRGSVTMDQAAYGVADIVVYRGEPVENDLFVHPKPECPDEIDLMDLGLPYIHYISTYEDRSKAIRDGSSERAYFDVNGKRIYKGFLLQTNVHFSAEAGPTGNPGTSIAAGTLGGSVMVGAVGGSVVSAVFPFGALIALASGGSAYESSCAAFNTWGEYDYVTFTVEGRVHDDGDSIRFKSEEDTLWVGVDGRVVEIIQLYEGMKPTTYTIPINKAKQLMFWMPCLGWGSQQYVFYDLKVSKGENIAIDLPSVENINSHAAIVAPVEPYKIPVVYTEKKGFAWSSPKRCGQDPVDDYFSECSKAFHTFDEFLDSFKKENYRSVARYVSSSDGNTYRAVTLENSTGQAYGFSQLIEYNESIIKAINQVQIVFTNLGISNVNANVGLISLGFKGIEYGKYVKNAAKVTKAYKTLLENIVKEKEAENELIRTMIKYGLTVDGKASDDKMIFVP